MIRYTIWQIFPTFINTVPLRAMPISTSGPWLWTRVYNNKFIAILTVILLWFRFGYWLIPGSASMLVLPDTFDVCLAKQKTFASCNNSLSDVYCTEIYKFFRTTYWFYLAVLEVVLRTVGLCKFLFLKMKSASPALGFFHHCQSSFGADRLWREEHPGETIEVLHGVGGVFSRMPLSADSASLAKRTGRSPLPGSQLRDTTGTGQWLGRYPWTNTIINIFFLCDLQILICFAIFA